jgi:hypothetical protein
MISVLLIIQIFFLLNYLLRIFLESSGNYESEPKPKQSYMFELNQPLILDESVKYMKADWYRPGIFYIKKRHPGGSIKANKYNHSSADTLWLFSYLRYGDAEWEYKNGELIKEGFWKNELVECHNSSGEVLICTENKFKPAPLEELREEKINILLKYD